MVICDVIQNINSWRERLPHSSESLVYFKSILDQRNFAYGLLYKRLKVLLGTIITDEHGD